MPNHQNAFAAIVSDYVAIRSDILSAVDHADRLIGDQGGLKLTILNALIVAVTALIEQTLRELFKCYLREIQASHRSHRNLRADLQRSNFESYVNAIKKKKEPSEVTNAHTIIKSFELCVGGLEGFELRIDDISYNEGNCRTAQITELAKKIGIREIIRLVCDCQEFSTWSGEDTIERTITRFTTDWNALFDERDLVVHQMSNASGWGATKLVQVFDQVNIFVNRLSNVLHADLSELIAIESARQR